MPTTTVRCFWLRALAVLVVSMLVFAGCSTKTASFLDPRAGEDEAHQFPYGDPLQRPQISLVIGVVRRDGLTYWEFIRERALKSCPRPDGSRLPVWPHAIPSEVSGGGYLFRVVVSPACYELPFVHIGALWSETGKVVPVDPGEWFPKEGRDGKVLRNQELPSEGAWLTDFLEGRDP